MATAEAYGAAAEKTRAAAERLLDSMDAAETAATAEAVRQIAAEAAAVAEFHRTAAARFRLERVGREARSALARAEQKIERASERV